MYLYILEANSSNSVDILIGGQASSLKDFFAKHKAKIKGMIVKIAFIFNLILELLKKLKD